ncbi:MAG: hypothetical protein FWH06_00165 [Oscillospiraceae bacterium]|nr:hypothetical protein [Oscillospiraceae bacterium]
MTRTIEWIREIIKERLLENPASQEYVDGLVSKALMEIAGTGGAAQ